jgi:hypothetical protein
MGRVMPYLSAWPRIGQEVTVVVGEPVDLSRVTCRWATAPKRGRLKAGPMAPAAWCGRQAGLLQSGAQGMSHLRCWPAADFRARPGLRYIARRGAAPQQGKGCRSNARPCACRAIHNHAMLRLPRSLRSLVVPPLCSLPLRCNHAGEDQQEVWRDIAAVLRESLLQLERQSPPNPNQVELASAGRLEGACLDGTRLWGSGDRARSS